VRELQNLVERSFTITRHSIIHTTDIPSFSTVARKTKDLTLKEAVSNFEQQYIAGVLETVDHNRKKAAQILGIHRNTLSAKIGDLNLKK
jgi:two-component system, NtrC family, response regulator HydG